MRKSETVNKKSKNTLLSGTESKLVIEPVEPQKIHAYKHKGKMEKELSGSFEGIFVGILKCNVFGFETFRSEAVSGNHYKNRHADISETRDGQKGIFGKRRVNNTHIQIVGSRIKKMIKEH